mmetsp:Transcript_63375/g.127262  ORF Transcript_63375/g.127262 Transcript_63375/m.127262 type:complete len:310 (+) Transcript_63375:188-1117(+)
MAARCFSCSLARSLAWCASRSHQFTPGMAVGVNWNGSRPPNSWRSWSGEMYVRSSYWSAMGTTFLRVDESRKSWHAIHAARNPGPVGYTSTLSRRSGKLFWRMGAMQRARFRSPFAEVAPARTKHRVIFPVRPCFSACSAQNTAARTASSKSRSEGSCFRTKWYSSALPVRSSPCRKVFPLTSSARQLFGFTGHPNVFFHATKSLRSCVALGMSHCRASRKRPAVDSSTEPGGKRRIISFTISPSCCSRLTGAGWPQGTMVPAPYWGGPPPNCCGGGPGGIMPCCWYWGGGAPYCGGGGPPYCCGGGPP